MVGLSITEFMRQVSLGTPQALEALWAPDDAVEIDRMRWLRSSLRPGTATTAVRYRRTITAFERQDPTPKRRRHAVRLEHDLGQFLAMGRIDPRSFSGTPLADGSLYGL